MANITDKLLIADGYENILAVGRIKYFTKGLGIITKLDAYYIFGKMLDVTKHDVRGEVETMEELAVLEAGL